MNHLKGKKVLLIGGAGFIGHHLAIQLKEAGADVKIMDSLNVNNLLHHAADNSSYANDRELIPVLYQRLLLLKNHGIENLMGDASDLQSVRGIIQSERPEVVVFLAALSNAIFSNQQPYIAFESNLRAFHNVLCESRGIVSQVIFFSSSMVYGDFKSDSVSEETTCDPKGVYGYFKLMGESLCELYRKQFGLNYTVIRPSALYGNRCVSRRVSQLFIEKAIRGEELVLDGDGSARLDFTHIDDVVQGVMRCIGNPAAMNEIFNITFGDSRSLRQLVEILAEYFPDLRVTSKPSSAPYVRRGTLSIEKARRLIGYEPQNEIQVGYRKYIEWCIANEKVISQFNTQIPQ